MENKDIYIVPDELEGVRLDKLLAEIVPDAGLRLRRRLCDEGTVLAGERIRKPGYKVKGGQEIVLLSKDRQMSQNQFGVRVVKQAGLFAAVFKPGGIHSADIAGKDSLSIESLLPDLLDGESPILLNRLDFLTSGLLLVAMSNEGANLYRDLEASGKIKKFYQAKVHGRLDGVFTIKTALDADNRKKTRTLGEDSIDERRWTAVDVLSHDHAKDTTVVRCLINKGARHQIRVHLASLGHPILGDPLYGNGGDGKLLSLCHYRVELPGFSASIDAPWQ